MPERAQTATNPGIWAPAPRRPRLQPAALDVWRADLEDVSDDLTHLLSDDEHARAAHIVGEHDRRLWSRSRGLLRALLGRYLHVQPAALRFDAGPHGKPSLLEPRGAIEFNLSHSDTLALYALSNSGPVGIDVEAARRPLNEVAVAARMLGPEAADRLQALDPEPREREFLRLWARREAEAKCLGTGIARRTVPSTALDVPAWVADLDAGPRAAAAVALEREPRHLRCFYWRA